MVEEYTKKIITLLANKYHFDGKKEIDLLSKKERKVLPWVGVVIEGNCRGLRWSHGLHTQCRSRCR